MSKKEKAVRTKPGSYVSIKVDRVSIYAKFIRYANRAVICKLSMLHKDDEWRWHIEGSREGKALCHPGDPEKNMPADIFVEDTGMGIAYLRASKLYNKEIAEVREAVAHYEKLVKQGNELLANMEHAIETMELEFNRLREENLIVCETKEV